MFKLELPLSLLLSLLLTDENKIYITFTLFFSFTKFEYTLLLKNFFTDLQLLIVIEQFINGCLREINILEYLIYYNYFIILLSILIFMFYIDIGFFLFLLPLRNLIIYNYYRTKIVLSVVPMTVGLVLSANNEETSLNSEQDTNSKSKSESESESESQSESESESSNNNIVSYNENKG
jgi:hypothetical protein